MKNSLRLVLSSLTIAFTAAAFGGTPALDVMVADAAGKMVYKGKTAADGTFASGALPAGDYVVQLNARAALNGNYALVLSAGKQKVVAEAVAGSKFAKGGVAMRIKVAKGLKIAGQVSSQGAVAATTTGNPKVKIINGKRYVWQGPETGSQMGGRWVEEGSAMKSGVIKGGSDVLGALQDRSGQGSGPGN